MRCPHNLFLSYLLTTAFALPFGRAENLISDVTNKQHADSVRRYCTYEKLFEKSEDQTVIDDLTDLREVKKELDFIRDRRDRHIEFEGWADKEYYDILVDECYGTVDWQDCQKKLEDAGYPKSAIEKSSAVAQRHKWQWLDIRVKRKEITNEIKKDKTFPGLNGKYRNHISLLDKALTKREKSLKEDNGKGVLLLSLLDNCKDYENYFQKNYAPKEPATTLCETLKACQFLDRGLSERPEKSKKK